MSQLVGFLLSFVVLMLSAGPAFALQDSAFTYQGELRQNGALADGSFDMEFSLWDALSGGARIGAPVGISGVAVADGRFAVELDFGGESFDNSDRWLEIKVEGFTLSPRNAITRSPYSVQTRGIFVDDAGLVGMGTIAPEGPLHVAEGSAGDVTAHFRSTGVFERLGHNYVSILSPDASERGLLFGDPESFVNGGIIYNATGAPDGFQFRTGGNQVQMEISDRGDVTMRHRVGVGNPSSFFGQLSIADSGDGAIFAIDASSNNSTFPAIFANNPSGPALWAQGLSDASLGGGGLIVAGNAAGPNVAIDTNEIMARNAGQSSTLYLNHDGGEVSMGPYGMHPAHAYGRIRADGSIISASANVTGARVSGNSIFVQIAGGVLNSDIALATDAHWNSEACIMIAQPVGSELRVLAWGPADSWQRSDFSFVVYRN